MTETNWKEGNRSDARRPAVWLARLARETDTPNTSSIGFQRATARGIATQTGVALCAEYLYVADEGAAVSRAGWRELLQYVDDLRVAVVAVLTPEEVAADVRTYVQRVEELERRQVELLLLVPSLAAGDAAPQERSGDVAA